MALVFHPAQGSLVIVKFEPGFIEPEMVKRRPCIVLSLAMKHRPKLLTVVALSTTPPKPAMPFHVEIDLPFALPMGWSQRCWVKGDMINTVGFHRTDLIQLGKDRRGKRVYQTSGLPKETLALVQRAVLAGLGIGP